MRTDKVHSGRAQYIIYHHFLGMPVSAKTINHKQSNTDTHTHNFALLQSWVSHGKSWLGPAGSAQPAADRMVRCSNPARDLLVLGNWWNVYRICRKLRTHIIWIIWTTQVSGSCQSFPWDDTAFMEKGSLLGEEAKNLKTKPPGPSIYSVRVDCCTFGPFELSQPKLTVQASFCCAFLLKSFIIVLSNMSFQCLQKPRTSHLIHSATFCWTIRQFRADHLAMASQSSTDFDDLWWTDLHVLPTWPQQKTYLGHCWVNQSLYPRVPNLDIRTVRTLCHQLSIA